MKTIATIKREIANQRQRLRGESHAVSLCLQQTRTSGQDLLSHPLSLGASFLAGWLLARWSQRPTEIKQAKNVTIKRKTLGNQLVSSLLPLAFSEIRNYRIQKDIAENKS